MSRARVDQLDYGMAQRFLDGLQREIAACNQAIATVEKRCANPA